MGFFFSRLQNLYRVCLYGPPAKVLMFGNSHSGKTTALYRLKTNETVETIPTCGFNVEKITPATGMTLDVLDVGGGMKIRKESYAIGAEGLIFIVDSSDQERFEEALDELKRVVYADTTTCGIPFVVMANKQDLPDSLNPSQLTDSLCLREFVSNKWAIQGTCATTGQGLHECVETLCEMIRTFRKDKR